MKSHFDHTATVDALHNNIPDLVDYLLAEAVRRGASDVHFEPHENGLNIRLRMDGMLSDYAQCDALHAAQLIMRLKVIAGMSITQKRTAQDGKATILVDERQIDLRFAAFPTLYDQKIVVRILDTRDHAMNLDQLGFSELVRAQIERIIQRSNGFFLVVGPTGSGKTTTLYAMLSALNTPEKNMITLEDPIEYRLAGITQGQVCAEAGFGFEDGVRSMLRQDPDVLMIGEIRDKQTARVAIEASLTGHLVFSTLHTHDTASAVVRLMDMGIEPFLINAALTGVLAQRLVRKICTDCAAPDNVQEHSKNIACQLDIDLTRARYGAGCVACRKTGYKGRTALFELLMIDDLLRDCITNAPRLDQIRTHAIERGTQPLLRAGVDAVHAGLTTIAELIRVLA